MEPCTIDELIRARARALPDIPLVSYPHHGIQYVDYTAQQLDQYAFHVAKQYAASLSPRVLSSDKALVVGLLGLSSLDYLISALAIVKLGHTVLYLSTRISHEAYVSLLVQTKAVILLTDETADDVALKCVAEIPYLKVQRMLTSEEYVQPVVPTLDTNLTPTLDRDVEQGTIAWIIHSSGSTGLPKPIYQTQSAAINNYRGNMGMKGFITLPLFHAHGLNSTYRAIYSGKQIHLYNAKLPLTKQYLIEIMRQSRFEIFYAVPYVLKLLAEDQEGIQLLANCKIVTFGGSACPDPLGDKLVENGVNLVSHWGSTETGQLMTSLRPPGDKAWNYMRPSESVQPYLRMEDRGEGLFEAVCLPGWPSKVATNRADGSFAMSDLFTKHPQQNWWKYYGRLDDTIVLVNGEKAMPLPVEGAARQHPWVSEAVVFGKGRDRLGLALVRAPTSAGAEAREIVRAVLATVETNQSIMPSYARITEDMVLLLDADSDYPRTDKGTVIRMKFYKRFERQIDALYESIDNQKGTLELNEDELRLFLKRALQSTAPGFAAVVADDDEQDFFNAGMDSLLASRLRAAIVKDIALGESAKQKLGINVAFEHPSISRLARYLYALRTGGSVQEKLTESVEETMQRLIDKYSETAGLATIQSEQQLSSSPSSSPPSLQAHAVILTGVTGSLGAHIAWKLLQTSTVTHIYCLIRASTVPQAQARLTTSFTTRGLPVPIFDDSSTLLSSSPSSSSPSLSHSSAPKLIALPSDLTRSDLGLDSFTLRTLRSTTRTIIHSAWSVNFNLTLSSFEDCIRSTHNLLRFAASSITSADDNDNDNNNNTNAPRVTFNFCSSISTVMNTAHARATHTSTSTSPVQDDDSPKTHIPETIPPLSHAQSMGYAQSKLVTEHIIRNFSRSSPSSYQSSPSSSSSSSFSSSASSTQTKKSKHNKNNNNSNKNNLLVTRVLRIGQIIGDTVHGIWNPHEAVPTMIRSAVTIGALPVLDERLRWLPVDLVAGACVDVALRGQDWSVSGSSTSSSNDSNRNGDDETDGRCQVYNIINPQTMHWMTDLLPALRTWGLEFDQIPVQEWLSRLRKSNQDPTANPPVKLLDFWMGKYGTHGYGQDGKAQRELGRVEYTWATENVMAICPALLAADREAVSDVVKLSLKYFQSKCW